MTVRAKHPGVSEAFERFFGVALLLVLLFPLGGCGQADTARTPDGRLIVTYWEKWTGFEGDAIQGVIDDFNATQDAIFVRRLTVSQIEQKVLLATAGGNPPDLAGLWDHNVASYAERGALTPLDRRLAEAGIDASHYLPALWDICEHRGYVWALPTTPATTALHWNKALFRGAGLDPDRPPQTLAELDAMAERLTFVELERDGQVVQRYYSELTEQEKQAKAFRLLRVGFSPDEPGWWKHQWGEWFGAELWDQEARITSDHPANVEAMRWFGSYTQKYGTKNFQRFGESFGEFASPQNPFLDGRIAMVLQGVWMFNFIDQYAPTLEWGATPFPSADPSLPADISIVSCDVIVIPRGAKNVDAAFEFLKYLARPEVIEKLCLEHRKFSPLARHTESFLARHPNPAIDVFIDLANAPAARTIPQLSIWLEYRAELDVAADRVFDGLASPEDALAHARQRMQWKLDRELERWNLTKDRRMKAWSQQ